MWENFDRKVNLKSIHQANKVSNQDTELGGFAVLRLIINLMVVTKTKDLNTSFKFIGHMGFAIAFRVYTDTLDNKVREEIIFAESPARLATRFDKGRETRYEERHFPNLSGTGLPLAMGLNGPDNGMFYAQGGGIGGLYPEKRYVQGTARGLFNDIVAAALSATVNQPDFNQDEWMYRTMARIVGKEGEDVSNFGYRGVFVDLYKGATDEQRAQFLKETKFGELLPDKVDETARRWDRDPFQGLPASSPTRSEDIKKFLRPKES